MTKFDIPTEQWAQVVDKFGSPNAYRKIPVAKPGPDEILVNIKFSGVCHSDVHARAGDWPMQPKAPVVTGHEGAGVVVAKGDLVTQLEIGDYAGLKWINGTCQQCHWCKDANEQQCPDAEIGGYLVDGSYQQYAIVKASAAAKIPKECDLAGVAPVMCAGLTMYKGLKESGARPGQYVAIVGAAGGLGSYGLQYAKAMGLIPIAVDGGPEKGQYCKELGAEAYVDFEASKSVSEDLKKVTGGLGPHAALIAAGEADAFVHVSELVRPLGTVVAIGIPSGKSDITSQIFDTILHQVTIKGSLVGNRIDTDEALDFFRRGLINVPHQVIGLSQLNEALDAVGHNQARGRYVVDTSK